ncbi:Histidine kinase-, DNA gyrase B-, and HSP90-like ATPase [Paenibacillus sp. UNCCL117]|uniref:cache domain-containing sensor histidine kinase n=1 Tax=unclassified Paenibacillus TaxID=185978 RepID=UPI0008832604|nr:MULTISPECIES: sensor histidine kinase [unclassified Paenibacillus]SDD24510.1 Histidine kinase-, DNA gyrase B-, and HSP90-like ATPase [Paenibacillus sp. cl123]SFW41471.1 Histidine kinase-, DNA gyrase B-, and HSP90-like ATPase [Paenibacillus sp. UNCCL117]
MSIRSKLFLTNSIVVILLLVSLTFVFEHYSRQAVLAKIEENNRNSLSQLAENMDNFLGSYEQIADLLYMDDGLQEQLLRPFHSISDLHSAYFERVFPLLQSIRSTKEIRNLTLYSNNPNYWIGDIKPLDALPLQIASSCYPASEPKFRSIRSWSGVREDNEEQILRLTQRLNHHSQRACLFAAIDVDVRLLEAFVRLDSSQSRLVVSLPDGGIVFDSSEAGAFGGRLEDQWFYADGSPVETGRVVREDGKEYWAAERTLQSRNSVRGIRIVSLTPLNQLAMGAREMRATALLLLLVAIGLFVIVNYLITSGLTRRLIGLSVKMRKTDIENLQPIEAVEGNDEVSQLGRRFNEMVGRMQRLITEVYESKLERQELELRTKESQLYALQTQVNPHYLFNTLNAIRGNLLEKGDRENAEIVTLLARSFRNVLGKSGQMVTLAEELDIVETYLKIQAFRFADRLSYSLAVPRPLHRIGVPKLSLQTLVENAIVHALEPSAGSIHIAIRAVLGRESGFTLTVEDNGPGIAPEQLAAIRERLDAPDQPEDAYRIGLRNVHQRLRQSFGPAYGLRVESEAGQGARLSLILPLDMT